MDRRKVLLMLLLLWTAAIVAGGIWRLLALDPETLAVTSFGEARLQQEFRDR